MLAVYIVVQKEGTCRREQECRNERYNYISLKDVLLALAALASCNTTSDDKLACS
jgi:hypothetical protein